MPKTWKILSVATVAVAMVRRNGNRWTSAKRAVEPEWATSHQVWHLLVERPELFRTVCLKQDMHEAKRALADLTSRDNLSASDLRLRALLLDCGRAGGVTEADIRKVAMIGAYWVNGLRHNYPRKDQWEDMRGSVHVGAIGERITINQPAKVTHVIHLDPIMRGGKTRPATPRQRRIYKVLAEDGNAYQWVELQRTHQTFCDLTKGQAILLRSGKVKSHETCEGVALTEFYENDVALNPNM